MSVAISFFLFFLMFGVIMPYLSPVLVNMGYDKQQVGFIWAGLYFFNMVGPIVGGRISDRYLSADRTLRISALIMTVAAVFWWSQSEQPSLLFLLALFVFQAARSPCVSLHDSLAMSVADNDAQKYSRIRMVGSIGFAVSVTLFAYLEKAYGYAFFFIFVIICCSVYALHTLRLPAENKSAPPNHEEHSGFWRSLSFSWWMWLLAMMFHWFSFGPFNYGFTLLLEEEGVPLEMRGWYWTIGIAVEVILFMVSGWFFKRWSYRTLLFVAFFSNLIRWALIGIFPSPGMIAFTQLLHGPGFALFYAAAIKGIAIYCEGRDRTSFQGLFSTSVGGVSSILGTLAAGTLHNHMPWREMILWFLPTQALAIFLLYRFPLVRKDQSKAVD